MDVESLGLSVRLFLRNLLGSRLSAHLEEELMRNRADYETRLQERDRTISDLREQCALLSAKIDRYELVIIPLSSPIGQMMNRPAAPPLTPKVQVDNSLHAQWQEYRERGVQYEEDEDGIQDQGRPTQVEQVPG